MSGEKDETGEEELKTLFMNTLRMFSSKLELGRRTADQDLCDNITFWSFCTFCSRIMILNFNSGF